MPIYPRRKKILVVEDEKPMAKTMALKLKHAGFNTKIALDGLKAVELLTHEQFDLVLLDLILPKLDGFSVLAQIKEKGILTPVIVISLLGQPEDIKRVKELGVLEYFIKYETPMSDIVEFVKKQLGKKY